MKYIRMHQVEAEPMCYGKYCEKWPNAKRANMECRPEDEGYVVHYPDGYVSWCPKAQFEAAARPCGGMTFGMAIEAMKRGWKVTRHGWNDKGMYIWVIPGSTIRDCLITDPHLAAIDKAEGEIRFLGSIRMRTATGGVLTGWLASQTDMLAEDWEIVE